MKNEKFFICLFAAVGYLGMAAVVSAAGSGRVKLPYAKGESFTVASGYGALPTHIFQDRYALDFTQSGCDAYGKPAVAAASGTVLLADNFGFNGGYGAQVLIDHGEGVVSRYAHLVAGTVPVRAGDHVAQGGTLGKIGDTGLVRSLSCLWHPGTHLHFAMYDRTAGGGISAHLPEPISGYTNLREGQWYISDNGTGTGAVLGVATSAPPVTAVPSAPVTAPPSVFSENTTTYVGADGGGSGSDGGTGGTAVVLVPPASGSSGSSESPGLASSTASGTASTTTTATTSAAAGMDIAFDSTTLALDLSWQPPQDASDTAGSTTRYDILKLDPDDASGTAALGETTSTAFSYQLTDGDFGGIAYFAVQFGGDGETGGGTTIAEASATVPAWFDAIQTDDGATSHPSGYSANWYDLGTGFYGTIRSLTLEGFINNQAYFASELWLEEYLDPAYAKLNQTFPISADAPFTAAPGKVTIRGLDIPLQPNKYYRLGTYQHYQNMSVVLAGTSATGTAAWSAYVDGVGKTDIPYQFYPYLTAIMVPDWPPLRPPNPPANATVTFDSLDSRIDLSWPSATDPDTTSSLLTYELAVTTSTALDHAPWQSLGTGRQASSSVAFGSSYLFGVRAVDDFGATSTPLAVPWNFPDGYVPVPAQLDHSVQLMGGAQSILFPATTTISGIALWTYAEPPYQWCCSRSSVALHADSDGAPGDVIATSNQWVLSTGVDQVERLYQFSPPAVLAPGRYWFELVDRGSEDRSNGTMIFGSPGDIYPDGEWSGNPGQDAYFRLQE
ncbi:MAG TPA: M23 family metallopeptidase [Candidatus Paceibacterota bacterium]|nr:M23 family metallopeptidase [Candidatus Paceibacterota bacterium]